MSLLVSAVVALLTLGGCGGAASGSADRDSGTLAVGQSGAAEPRTIWYVRVETTDAEPVFERAFPDRKISLTRSLKPGEYRVISWYRACRSACPTFGERGVGPLEQVCGAPVTVARGKQVNATVRVGADGCVVDVR